MARFYHVDIARFAANADHKWVDNLLSAHTVPGVESEQRGVARRISTLGIYHIALVRELSQSLGVSVDSAVDLARRLLASPSAHLAVRGELTLQLDRLAFERVIDARIADAVEAIVPARRGRPAGVRTRAPATRGDD